jgi:hypothetical protein
MYRICVRITLHHAGQRNQFKKKLLKHFMPSLSNGCQ